MASTVYTDLRHGELLALAWEDIDLEAGTITVKRNLTLEEVFKLPKTRSGERVISRLNPAIDALKRLVATTFMYSITEKDVLPYEHGKLMPILYALYFTSAAIST
ncbi:hypothetical protein [Photobacterium sanguinicancri]|uniref:hypothetical protein n=1 Tax=Photobacterium sanguinicancri TaxID=875932 RepID=UPI003D0D5D35